VTGDNTCFPEQDTNNDVCLAGQRRTDNDGGVTGDGAEQGVNGSSGTGACKNNPQQGGGWYNNNYLVRYLPDFWRYI